MTVEEAIKEALGIFDDVLDECGVDEETMAASVMQAQIRPALEAIAEAARAETKPRRMRLVGGPEHIEVRGCKSIGCQPVGTGGAWWRRR